MPRPGSANPEIRWEDNAWSVRLPLDDGRQVEATWTPGTTYVVRIREVGHANWSFGFQTPLASFTFIDLKPDTEYEVQVRALTAGEEGEPSFVRLRTSPAGDAGNIVPFPKR